MNVEHRFIVWECIPRSSSLPLVGEIGCGNPNIMRSRLTNGNRLKRWMSLCDKCGCKRSLNRGIIHDFVTRAEAEEYVRDNFD